MRALAKEYRVRCAVLEEEEVARSHMPAGVEVVRGDVTSAEQMGAAIKGCAVVFHCAAVISIVGDPSGVVRRVNVGGAETVARAAVAEAACTRVVYMCSVHAFDLKKYKGKSLDEACTRIPEGSRRHFACVVARGGVGCLTCVILCMSMCQT